jgi:hypothetical protein
MEGPNLAASEPLTTASPLDVHIPPVDDRPTPKGIRMGKATVALILGITGIVTAPFFQLVGIVLGILGVVLGATARGDAKRLGMLGRRQATAGLICGIVAILIAAGVLLIVALTL